MTGSKAPIITIDGPAGAGKSTLARALASRLGYVYLDTGAIYRALALASRRSSTPWIDEDAVACIARDIVANRRLRFASQHGSPLVLLDGEDISEAIRTPEMSAGASAVSAHPKVREELLSLQRTLAIGGGVVAEGRDTGTVVFPDAEVKFFLTASVHERARRRFEQLQAKQEDVDFDATLSALEERDQRDEQRAAAPLRRARDAVDVDTTTMTIDEALDLMSRCAARSGG